MGKKFKILAVDDSAINLATIEQRLGDTYDIITMNSGVRALRYLKTERPDLILLDIKMDDKDGIETLKELRNLENGGNIPVIMLTAKNDTKTIMKSSYLGICDYVLKPFDTKDLHMRIERALKKTKRQKNDCGIRG